MFKQLSDRVAATVFIVLVLSVAWGTANVAEGLVLAVSPLLVVIAMLFVVSREGFTCEAWRRLGIGRLGLRTWPLAIVTTAGVSLIATIGVVGLGFANFTTPTGDWLQQVLILCITGPILAFAEEIGWRGYLQPRLGFIGERTAMLVIGLVWFAWHLPYILLTPYYHTEGNRAVVLALFGASVIAFSFLFGYLRIRSESVWPVVLAHFAHNATFASLATYAISTQHSVVVNEYLSGDTGLFILIGTAICAAVAFVRTRLPESGRATQVFATPNQDAS